MRSLIFCMIFTSAAYAQNTLEEIVVTAERRTTSLQNTAVSADVLSGDMLESKGIGSLIDLQYAAPALVVSDYGSANVTTIRGIGRSQVDIDVPSGVVIYRDGAPTFGGYFQNEPYFDMESVEVLRGPQGTFVGQSAAGGAIFINTKDPELGDEVTGSIMGGGGNYDRFEGEFIVNVPVSETIAIRAAYKHDQRSDFWDAIVGDFTGDPGEKPGNKDADSYRIGILWEPNDNFRSTLKVDYHDLDFGGSVVYSPGVEPLSTVEQNGRIAYKDESIRTVLEMNYQFDNGIELRSLSNFQAVDTVNHLDLNASDPLFYQFLSDFSVETWSQEVNLISPADDRFTYVLGLFYQEQEVTIPYWQQEGFSFIGNVGVTSLGDDFPWITSPWFQDQEFFGAFAHLTYALTDAITVEGGIRFNNYKVSQITDWTFGTGLTPPTASFSALFGFPAGPLEQSTKEDSLDGQIVINWQIDNDHFAYALASRGHNTGGINIFPIFREYDEMQVINYELGWKASWFNDQFRTQFSAYYQPIDDYQANFGQAGQLIGPDNRSATDESTIWGLELSSQARINNWSVDFSAAYMNSELGTFEDVLDPFLPAPNNVVDLTGVQVPFAPEINASLGIGYDYVMANGYTLSPRVDASYQGTSRAALWINALTSIRARTLINAKINLTPPSDDWKAEFWATNLADHKYTSGIQNNGTLRRAGAPREFGVRLKYFF